MALRRKVCGVVPNDEITYTITFAPDPNDHTNVYVTDYLPLEVEFISADPDTGEPNDVNRTYTWYIGEVDGGNPNVDLELVVEVTSAAEPSGVITNEIYPDYRDYRCLLLGRRRRYYLCGLSGDGF